MSDNLEKLLVRLADFLHKANKNTFANASVKKAQSLRPGSSDYHFEEGGFIYHDTYFGDRDFIGEEIVYENQRAVWGMNYYGYTLDKDVSNHELIKFLEKSIMQEYDDVIPVRGPKIFTENNWTYRLIVDGQLDRFSGVEEILFSGRTVYRLHLQGGLLK